MPRKYSRRNTRKKSTRKYSRRKNTRKYSQRKNTRKYSRRKSIAQINKIGSKKRFKKSTKKNSKRSNRRKKYSKRKSNSPMKGWNDEKPHKSSDRIKSYKQCGRKCFLEPNKLKFPVCAKDSCELSCKGLLAAKIRGSQWKNKYPTVFKRAHNLALKKKCSWAK